MSEDLDYSRCYYCGDIATGIDHVPPRAVRLAMSFAELEKRHWIIKDVPCCLDCNSRIQADAPFNLLERKALVKRRLRRRYARYLAAPEWKEEEIHEMGNSLKTYILNFQKIRAKILARLAW